ncbi:MAG TPA: OmpW family outer membrane protein [Pseudomonadales bacterium]|nr:OmpW family outer membrane protein [Pseudomonadales bacterium]
MKAMKTVLVGGVMLMGAAMGAQAYEAGDWIVRAGAATVVPNDSSSVVKLNGAPAVAGGEVRVSNNTQLGLTGTYMFTPNVGVGLLAATPFKHDITANDKLSVVSHDIGSTEHLPPTLTAQYYFNNSSVVTPYVGLGLNYTTFFHTDVDPKLEAALGGHSSMKLSDSWGLAAEAGMDVSLGNNWLLNASVWYIDIDTQATITSSAGNKVKTDVTIDPWVYMVGVGYKF